MAELSKLFGGLAALVSLGLLAACSEIPTSGPVVAGNPVSAQEPLPYVAFGAAEPLPGDDPAGIVDGFLDAMSAYEPGYETAKLFLTPEALTAWEPASGIVIHTGTRPGIEAIEENRVNVTFTVSGEVREDGSYRVADPGSTRTFELLMEQVDGEWRVANPPAGTIISESNFTREFEPHNLCFFDAELDVFVLDPVYVAKNAQTATLLAQMLLAGPSEWLDPAVRTAFAESVTLSVPSVPVESGLATVDLSLNAQDTDPAQRDRMAAQLACTLSGLPEVSQINMNTDGIPMLGADAPSVTATLDERFSSDPSASGVLFAVNDGVVVARPSDSFEAVSGPLREADDISELAVPQEGDRAAVVSASGTALQVAPFDDGEERNTVLEGAGLASPFWDRNNLIWAVDRSENDGELVAVRPDGTPVEVRDAELSEHAVDQVSVSPDGTRVALIADGVAYMALIVHDLEDRDHVSIEQLRQVGPEGTMLDAAWAGAERLALLHRSADTEPDVLILDTFGSVQASRGSVAGAVSLSASSDQGLVVATEDGMLLEHQARTRWVEIGAGTAPAYP